MARPARTRRVTPAGTARPTFGSEARILADSAEPTSKFQVTLRNRGLVFEVGGEEAILDIVEAAGVVLPVGCRYGGCITCAARLVKGKVRQPNGTALNRRQSQAGYVLLCIARPMSDCVLDVGVESHGALFVNPFAAVSARGRTGA